MKKVLALVLAAVMALSLATAVSAAALIAPDATPDTDSGATTGLELVFGDKDSEHTFYLEDTDPTSFYLSATPIADIDGSVFKNTGDYSLSVSVSSNNSDVVASYSLIKNSARDGVAIKVTVKPLAEKFTVEEAKDFKVTVNVVQASAATGEDRVSGKMEITGTVGNTRADSTDMFQDAHGNYTLDTAARVIDVSVFEDAEGKALSVNYSKYSVKFAKVAKQNTSLYLHATTSVAEGSKAIAAVGFKPTRVKDAATITMPIGTDNQNLYGETVYVYALVDGKPTGEAIAAEVVNHNAVIFSVPAGTTLGAYAAYGDLQEGEAEKPAIPETGANDIVNIAIVFAVVALAAAGFVAVNKAGK